VHHCHSGARKKTIGQQREMTDHPAEIAFLYDRIDYERRCSLSERGEFRLDRMRQLMERLGNPAHSLPCIHVAGTKGKGSTACMIHQVARQAGYRVGLYTSPHLERLEERFVVDGAACRPDQLGELLEQVRPVVESMDRQDPQQLGPTFFDITTAMAILFFRQSQVDLAVLEVGLGGRLDSTNICHPDVTIITNIGLDHTHLLGSTIELIAAEKAGIIKPGVPVISGTRLASARAVIRDIAEQNQAPTMLIDDDFRAQVNGQLDENGREQFTFSGTMQGKEVCWENLSSGIPGRHQVENAAVALAAIGQLGDRWPIEEEAIREGLAISYCPARLELFGGQPQVLLDVAHNLPSVEALTRHLEWEIKADRRVLLFSCSRDKDSEGMLAALLPHFDHVVFTRFTSNPRAASPQLLHQQAASWLDRHPAHGFHQRRPLLTHTRDPASGWGQALEIAGSEDVICVAGSFFLAAEVRPMITPLAPVSHNMQAT
jgi:dihydrofolate synthase/folylpolyglutamate synthase